MAEILWWKFIAENLHINFCRSKQNRTEPVFPVLSLKHRLFYNCPFYIIEIVNGESYVALSDEEIQALKKAVNFGIEENEFDI